MTESVVIDGKHFVLGDRPFRVRGVTYGSFLPRLDGELFPDRVRVKEDFRMMAEAGLNTVRLYALPPLDVLDIAVDYGLRVLVGLNYHDWRMEPSPGRRTTRRVLDAGRRAVAEAVERCSGRPEVLAIAVGNELPVDVVRVHGIGAVQDSLSELVADIHAADPALLATYVNFPTTEFLAVEGQDVVCFNVFLEDPSALRRYLRHLQVVAGSRPLVVTELGLASTVHGEAAQAHSIHGQLEQVDETGCAGATVFAWTDEWGVAGQPVEGWGFGITGKERTRKPALEVVREWANTRLVDRRVEWPSVSVVVCAYNEERTIEECLTSLARSEYPNFEVLVCDDGSTDRTLEIARRFKFRILQLPHGGLSRARNSGMEAASGAIVAYIDADAACHPEWLFHIVLSMEDEGVVATGGPNLPARDAGFVERAVALSPGGPIEVLMTDDRAEHVPGCNMAYRIHALKSIGGFDAMYTSAGDDVDVCWKLLERGQEIAFAPAAQVRHHRRPSVAAYLKQQRGYGKAEKLLIGAHPHRFNRVGQARWSGVMYGGGGVLPSLFRPVVYHGYQGSAPFQSVDRRRAETAKMWSSALLPTALPVALIAALMGVISSRWWLLVAAATVAAIIAYGLAVATALEVPREEPQPTRFRLTVGALHVLQPYWRTYGRLRGQRADVAPIDQPAWSGNRTVWLSSLEAALRARRCVVRPGGPSHNWDLEVSASSLIVARITTAVMWNWEPHLRVRYRPRPVSWVALFVLAATPILVTSEALIALGLVIFAMLADLLATRHRVRSAIRETTRAEL
jgi:hypothetical protein